MGCMDCRPQLGVTPTQPKRVGAPVRVAWIPALQEDARVREATPT
jgi:hypothetical protein